MPGSAYACVWQPFGRRRRAHGRACAAARVRTARHPLLHTSQEAARPRWRRAAAQGISIDQAAPSAAAHVGCEPLLLVVCEVAARCQPAAGEQHLEERVRIAAEVQVRRVEDLHPRLEVLVDGRSFVSGVLEDLNYGIREGARIAGNDDVPLACLHIHTTAE